MESTKAFAPANISCIFKTHEHKNPRWAGSYGVGFTLNKGVIAEIKKSNTAGIFFNNKKINFPTVNSVINRLTNLQKNFSKKNFFEVKIKTKLPLGCGFGLSGASALATAYALNKLLNLKKSKKELAVIAHTAEVENKTGLGDVVNQFYGGFCLKFKPSSYFIIKKLPINNVNVYCKYFGKIETKKILSNKNKIEKINKSAEIALSKIKNLYKKKFFTGMRVGSFHSLTNHGKIFPPIIKISKEFSIKSGLLKNKKVINLINETENSGGNASMIMLGNAVFSDKKFPGSQEFKISNQGARLL